MRHKYMKSLLLAVVALFGFATSSSAQSYTYKIKTIVNFITTNNADLSGQDIKIGWSEEELQNITPNSDGTYESVKEVDENDFYLYDYDSPYLYYSVNAISGSMYRKNREYADNYTTIIISYQINLYKFRFNYSGTNITNYDIRTNSSENISLTVNKDYYFPSLYFYYNDGSSYSRSVSLYEDTTIDLPILWSLTISSNVPESLKNDLYYSIDKLIVEDNGSSVSRYWNTVITTENANGCVKSLPEGTYRIDLRQRQGGYSSNSLGSKEVDLTSDQTVSFDVHTVTVKVVEADGTPVEGVSVFNSINNYNGSNGTTDANGYYSLIATNGSEIRIQCQDLYMSSGIQLFTLTGNKTITVTFPKIMSFKMMLNGKLYDIPENQNNYVYLYNGDQDNYLYARMIEKGTFQTRVNPEAEYAMQLYDYDDNTRYYYSTSNAIKITEGKTIRVGQFATKADGVGLDFFMGNGNYLNFDTEYGWNAVIVGGTPVRIAAVPVGNEQFVCWNINGKEYNSPMIDFTVKDDNTVATAKFTGTIANQVKGIAGQNAENIYVTIEGGYLVLPNDVEAEASIYAMDGKLTKKTGVVGNRIYINNLPDGAYVLVLSIDGRRQTATFIKQ